MAFRKFTTRILAPLLFSAGALAQPAADSAAATGELQTTLTGAAGLQCPNLARLRTLAIDKALAELYQRSGFVPLWQSSQRLAGLQRELAQLADDGLFVPDYGFALDAKPVADVCSELRVSSEYLLALEHLSLGRIPHSSFKSQTDVPPVQPPDLVDMGVKGLQDMPAAFDNARPTLPIYRELRRLYRAMDKQPASLPVVAAGATIKPGQEDSRLPVLVQRLQAAGYLVNNGTQPLRYEQDVEQAIKDFQINHGLQADGLVGVQTLAALNVSPQQRIEQVRINLERLRWLDSYRSAHVVLVNVAGGNIGLYRGEQIIWQSRVMSGRPERPTPDLVSTIDRITLNPAWTIPPTIFKEDKLPQIRRDPGFLQQNDLRVLDYQGQPVDPSQVDWNDPVGIMLRQPPGPTNPLGKIAFRFPSPFAIYLHDTPSQNLFEKSARNVSSGCVRVQDAAGLAAHLLTGKSAAELRKIALAQDSGETQEIALADGPRLVISYWTAEAAGNGRIRYLPDPYNRDPALLAAFRDLDARPQIQVQQAPAHDANECGG